MDRNLLSVILELPSRFSSLEDNAFLGQLKIAVKALLLSSTPSELMNAFYRLDLREDQTMSALSASNIDEKADKVARLIVKRLILKQNTRTKAVKS